MSDSYQLWRVEAPRHRDLTFVLFHRHKEGGTCSLSSIFKDVGTVMTLSEGYYTNQRVLRDACHVYHWLHLIRVMWACRQPKGAGIEKKTEVYYIVNLQWHFFNNRNITSRTCTILSNTLSLLGKVIESHLCFLYFIFFSCVNEKSKQYIDK